LVLPDALDEIPERWMHPTEGQEEAKPIRNYVQNIWVVLHQMSLCLTKIIRKCVNVYNVKSM
jgi:hypothetical protein